MTVLRLSLTSIPVRLFFDDIELGVGSGFLVNSGKDWFFATAWHNLTGRHRWTGKCLRKDAGVPNIALIGVRFLSHTNDASDRENVDERLLWVRIQLYDENGIPAWLVHPDTSLNADVALLPFSIKEQPPSNQEPLYVAPSENETSDMVCKVGSDLFILGYPFGVEPFPIWKRATVASEPHLTINRVTPFLSVDTATRQGLSGSPVYAYSSGLYETESGVVCILKDKTIHHRFIGIYTGRRPSRSGDDAQIGIVWMKEIIDEIITRGQIDCRPENIHPHPFPDPILQLPKPSDADR